MGRGDKKSKKGKRTIGSYGVSRNKTAIKARIKRNLSNKPAAAGEGSAEAPAKAAKRTTKKKAEA